MVSELNAVLVLGAGVASVLSPCVIPVVPLIVTGTATDHKLRPVLIVSGLALAFIAMGVVSSLFGAVIGPWMYKAEKVVGAVIVLAVLVDQVIKAGAASGAARGGRPAAVVERAEDRPLPG
ncbi:MAG: hypothetical protein EHM71_10155 [Zetaproteobacteria bacterium]|nr:MAG: hypothetical protein EHM71_10155 [Zetaproteobacteria bacterium]